MTYPRIVKDVAPHRGVELDRGPLLEVLRTYGYSPDSVVGIRFDAGDDLEFDVMEECEPDGLIVVTYTHRLSDPWTGVA